MPAPPIHQLSIGELWEYFPTPNGFVTVEKKLVTLQATPGIKCPGNVCLLS